MESPERAQATVGPKMRAIILSEISVLQHMLSNSSLYVDYSTQPWPPRPGYEGAFRPTGISDMMEDIEEAARAKILALMSELGLL